MRKISLSDLENMFKEDSYNNLYKKIIKEIKDGKIKPVKSSFLNGKSPSLHLKYWVIEEEKNYDEFIEELKFHLHPSIDNDFYLRNLERYLLDREDVLKLSDALNNDLTKEKVSLSERSVEIWGYEKYITKKTGKTLLKRCGLSISDLNIYLTAEPIAYYSKTNKPPQNILILENKDPFFGMRLHLMRGNETILGEKIDTLIYGKGKGIIRAFSEADISLEEYILDKRNIFYYFGDMDYEGINIYSSFKEKYGDQITIIPFIPAYKKMLEKCNIKKLIKTKEGQNKNLKGDFFDYFSESETSKMKDILGKNLYIPQEMLSVKDY